MKLCVCEIVDCISVKLFPEILFCLLVLGLQCSYIVGMIYCGKVDVVYGPTAAWVVAILR